MARALFCLTVLSCLVVCCFSRPMGGRFHDVIYSANSTTSRVNGTCHEMGLYTGGKIEVSGKIKAAALPPKRGINVTIGVKLYFLKCANFFDMPDVSSDINEEKCGKSSSLDDFSDYVTPVASGFISKLLLTTDNEPFILHPSDMMEFVAPTAGATEAPVSTEKPPANAPSNSGQSSNSSQSSNVTQPSNITQSTRRKRAAVSKENGKVQANAGKSGGLEEPSSAAKTDAGSVQGNVPVLIIGNNTSGSKSGMYLLQVYIARNGPNDSSMLEAHVDIKMRNPHGYLSAVDYPGLVFYGLMTSVYAIYGIAWIIMMLCSFSDLVRLQFWVMAVIILGFLEKTFFVAEYSAINLGNDTYGSYVIAEFVSAVKRGLSRMLLIIVAMGFGTVKPRLGDSLFKVVAAGVAYFSLALVDGIMRSRADTFHARDTSSVVTLALLLLLDTFIFYWIFTAIVDTRRTLRLRKNYVKLAMYNHFAYTLIFAVIATLAFIIWAFVALEYPSGACLTDWREAWLRDCFWHVLFAFILLVVMIIWRPSSNRSRFAYSLVADEEEVVFEQGSNKNFDTLKMRSVSSNKGEVPPTVTSQAEDDLRWVEENLPTTAMDKALPLLLDSDEEVMTTKFEMSKMN